MSESEVALIAAGSAAAVSLLVTLATLVSTRRGQAESAHRTILAPFLEELGSNLAGVVATSTVFLKRVESGQDLTPWRDRAERHAEALKDLRARVRYPLFGVEDGLLVLSRVASWVQHFKGRIETGEELLRAADELRAGLDRVIAKSYRRGQPPSWFDRRRVARRAKAVEGLWAAGMEVDAKS